MSNADWETRKFVLNTTKSQYIAYSMISKYSISQEICTRFLLCCALLWLYIDWFPISIRLTIAPVPAKQPWWIWINTSCEFIMNDCLTTTKQSTTKPCAYFLGYTVKLRSQLELKKYTYRRAMAVFMAVFRELFDEKWPRYSISQDWIGLDCICLTTTHVLRDILAVLHK